MIGAERAAFTLLVTAFVLSLFLVWTGHLGARVLDVVFALLVGFGARRVLYRVGAPEHAALIVGASSSLGALALVAMFPAVRLTPYLGILLVNLGLALAFARGLRPGQTPIILQLVSLMGVEREASPAFIRFVRGQCLLWTYLTSATALAGAAAMLSSSARAATGNAIVVLLCVQSVWFVVSHLYANRRYGRPETWAMTLRTMTRPRTWEALNI